MELKGIIYQQPAVEWNGEGKTKYRVIFCQKNRESEYKDDYFACTYWGDAPVASVVEKMMLLTKIDAFTEFECGVDVSSREYNGRWYTDLRLWRIKPVEARTTGETAAVNITIPERKDNALEAKNGADNDVPQPTDDLPF